jgi:hypothetical protein
MVDLIAPVFPPDDAEAATMDLARRPSASVFRTTLVGHAATVLRDEARSMPRDEAANTVRGHAASTGHDQLPAARSAMPAPAERAQAMPDVRPPRPTEVQPMPVPALGRGAPLGPAAGAVRSASPRSAAAMSRGAPPPYGQPQLAAPANPYSQPAPPGASPYGQPAPPSLYAPGYPQPGGYPQAANPFSDSPAPAFETTLAGAQPAPAAKPVVRKDARVQAVADRPMGMGAGGQISQRIYSDGYGIETWDEAACTELFIHIVSPQTWYAITGEPPPPTPVTFRAYQAAGLPWFHIYDEDRPGTAASPELAGIRPVDDFDRRR